MTPTREQFKEHNVSDIDAFYDYLVEQSKQQIEYAPNL